MNKAYTESFNQGLSILIELSKGCAIFTIEDLKHNIRIKGGKYIAYWIMIARKHCLVDKANGHFIFKQDWITNSNILLIKKAFEAKLIGGGNTPSIEHGRCSRIAFSRITQIKPLPENVQEDIIDSAIKLLQSNEYQIFKFHWMRTSLADKNTTKVVGYYNLQN